ncbi:MAG: type IV pilus assembly protein PilM [Gemmatimonadota bacterium]
MDVGSGVVKVVEVDHSGGTPRVVTMGISGLLPGAIVDGEVMDHHLVVNTIRSLYQGLGIKQKRVSTSVSGRDVIVKKISMDRMKEQEAREVIRWEAEQHVPFDMENVNLDFQILDPDADGLEMSVLLVAAKRDLVEARTILLQDAGLEPVRIDVDAFAVQTAFQANYTPEAEGVYGLVNVGHEITNVNLVQGSEPILTRDLPVGSNRFLETLQRSLGLSYDEANAALQGRPPAHVSIELVKGQLADVAQEITAGVDRARAFLTTGSARAGTAAELRLVYLSGGCATIPGLAEQLGQALSIPVDTLDPFRRVGYEPALFTDESKRELGPLLTLAVGLALQN